MIQKLTKATTRLLAILFAMFATGGAWAATPVAVWDGDFTTMTKGTYTLSENGNTKTDTYLQISGNNGVLVTSTAALNVFTVIVRCSGLDLSSENNQVLFTSNETSPNTRGNLTGVILPANNAICRGIWNGSAWDPNSSTAGYSSFVHNSVPAKYTTIIYNHQQTNGTYAYALGPTSDVDDTVLRTTLYSIQGLRSSGSTYSGCAIGGLRGTTSTTLLPATGLKITSIAVFSGTLTEDEMKHYTFPSETINVSSDTTVSAIKAQVPANQMIAVSAADGVTITVDEAFGNIVSVSSEGNVKLAAAEQPAASYFSGVDFSGVQGALLRSWVTDVVGFNFNAGQGNDTSTALVSGTWASDSSGGTAGSSTALFDDALSKLSWTSRGYHQWGDTTSFIHGYLDDNGSTQPSITLSNVPYETYDVIIYCATDSGSNYKFSAKQVNGTYYTWNGSATVSTADSTAAWGQGGNSQPAYGTNVLRVKNLSGALNIKGGPYRNDDSGKYRGSIAAIQVINTRRMKPQSLLPVNTRLRDSSHLWMIAAIM